MNEKKLLSFRTVAKYENISKAATELYISQPALSKAISELEAEVGCELFERNGKKISLNANGRVFLDYANMILTDYDAMRNALKESNANKVDHIRLGFGVCSQLVSDIAAGYAAHSPEIRLNVRASYPLDMMQDNLDIIINATTDKLKEDQHNLLTEKLVLALPENHPLINKDRICYSDLADYEFIMPDSKTEMRELICSINGLSPDVYTDCYTSVNNSYVQCELVGKGLGIAIVPEISWRKAYTQAGLVLREVEDMNVSRTVYYEINSRVYMSETLDDFCKFLEDFFGNI